MNLFLRFELINQSIKRIRRKNNSLTKLFSSIRKKYVFKYFTNSL